MLKLPYTEFHNKIVKRKIQESKIMIGKDAPIRSASTFVTKDTKLNDTEDYV